MRVCGTNDAQLVWIGRSCVTDGKSRDKGVSQKRGFFRALGILAVLAYGECVLEITILVRHAHAELALRIAFLLGDFEQTIDS